MTFDGLDQPRWLLRRVPVEIDLEKRFEQLPFKGRREIERAFVLIELYRDGPGPRNEVGFFGSNCGPEQVQEPFGDAFTHKSWEVG
jgi:hypothetical protein